MIEASVHWTDKDRYVGAATSRHSIVMDTATEKTANSPMELGCSSVSAAAPHPMWWESCAKNASPSPLSK